MGESPPCPGGAGCREGNPAPLTTGTQPCPQVGAPIQEELGAKGYIMVGNKYGGDLFFLKKYVTIECPLIVACKYCGETLNMKGLVIKCLFAFFAQSSP